METSRHRHSPNKVGSTALRVDKTGLGDIRIVQDPSGFCYGADAVMLAGFAAARLARSRNAPQRLCDLGTGNGIIPLLLSHHTEIREITGIDVQGRSIELAQQSNVLNGLTERLRFLVGNVRDIQMGASLLEALGGEGSYSVVTCNPPYTENCGGMKCEDAPRLIARHEVLGSLADFLQGASLLLRDKGDLFLVHRPARMVDVMCTCREHRLEPKTLQLVSGKRGEAPNIMLLHCVKNGGRELRTLPQQCAREENGAFSPWMKKMYQGEKNTAI